MRSEQSTRSTQPEPVRPTGDWIDIHDPAALRAWALWLEVDHAKLRQLVGIVGANAGQVEYILGKSPATRW